MKRFLQLVLLVAVLVCSSVAQSPIQVQVVVPRLIRFSGQLPGASGTVGITFTLHKDQQENAALWIETQNVQLDGAGKYTVLLGVTKPEGIPTDLFSTGEAQWLGIEVQGKAEQPRVLLVSVPYALRAAEADTLTGHTADEFVTTDKLSSAVHQELQQQATSSSASNPGTAKKSAIKFSTPTDPATDFIDSNTSQVVLVQQNGSGSALTATATTGLAINAKSTSTAIYGDNTGTGNTSGVEGITSSPAGRGVYGFNTATTGTNFGVVGSANSTSGIGVFGSNGAATGAATGVWGTTTSTAGIALKGSATGTSGSTTGVLATVKSPTGTALVLQNTGAGKIISGQSGSSNTEVFSVDGTGKVTGNGSGLSNVNAATLGGNAASAFPTLNNANYFTEYMQVASYLRGNAMYVLNGDSTDAGATAIEAVDKSPSGYGVYGEADGAYGIGVYGIALEYSYGVNGVAVQPSTTGADNGNGAGVWGDSGDWIGVLATSDTSNASFMLNNSSSDATLLIENESETGYVFEASGGLGLGYCNMDTKGNITCSGSVGSAYPTSTNRTLSTYAVQATENWYEDIGTAQLTGGSASVHFDPNFMEAVNTSMPYQVFLTPKGDSKGLYVSNEGPNGFEVHESGGGTVTMAFDYRIVAKRKGKESLRMQDITEQQKILGRRPASRSATAKPAAHPRPSVIQQRPALLQPN
jgi:hypothetical protein